MARVLVDGDFAPAPAQVIKPGDGDPLLLLASVMSRGQGKTDGLHQRELLLAGKVRIRLGQPDSRSRISRRASGNVQQAGKMGAKVLFPALRELALGRSTTSDDFDSRVDEVFFEELFGSIELEDDEAQLVWDDRLTTIAWSELQRAIDRCSVSSERWYRAVSGAEGMFHGCLRRQFPTLAASSPTGRSQGEP